VRPWEGLEAADAGGWRGARGAFGETLGENIEEVGGQFASNIGKQEVFPETSLTEGLGEAGAFATIGGATLGGGSGADIGEKIKGLPFYAVIGAILILAVVVILMARGSGWLTGKLLTGSFGKNAERIIPKHESVGTNALTGFVQAMMPKQPIQSTNQWRDWKSNTGVTTVVEESVFITACYPGAHGLQTVALSDGRQFQFGDGHCTAVNLNTGATIDGKHYDWQVIKSSYEKAGQSHRR